MRCSFILGLFLTLTLAGASRAQTNAEGSVDDGAAAPEALETADSENAPQGDVPQDDATQDDATQDDATQIVAPEPEPPIIYAQPAVAPAPPEEPPRHNVALEEDIETGAQVPREAPRLVLATTLGGLAGVVGGFGLSWGPSFGLAGTNQDAFTARVSAFVMGVTTWGTPLTTAVGIFSAGQAAGGNANFGVTLLGTSLGGIVGGGLAGIFYATEHSQALTLVGVLSIPALQWAGGVLAYHLSHRARGRAPEAPEFPETQSLPSLSIRPGGATLGWSGSF